MTIHEYLASPSGFPYNKVPEGRTKQRDWERTPNYINIPKDSLPINPYYQQNLSIKQNLYAGQTITVKATGEMSYAYPIGYLFTGTDIKTEMDQMVLSSEFVDDANEMDNANQVKLLNKVADAKVNFAVSMAEARKTYDMIESAVERLGHAMVSLRRGRFKDVAKTLNLTPNTVHKTWLEYKYGWTPYLMEVKGQAELFAQHVLQRKKLFVVSCMSKFENKLTAEKATYLAFGGLSEGSYGKQLLSSYEVHHKLWLSLTSPIASAAQQMGLTNPALLAWELIPYSFVFDWFISVGDWLTAITALDGITVVKGYRSNINTHFYNWTQPATIGSNSLYVYWSGERTRSVNSREYGRSSYAPDPLKFSIPNKIGNPFRDMEKSFPKMVTSIALVKARVTRTIGPGIRL